MNEPLTPVSADQSPPSPNSAPVRIGAAIDPSNTTAPFARYYLSTAQLAAVGLLATIFIVAGAFPLWYSDIWMHVKFGEWIATHGRLPAREPFCQWSEDHQPVVQFSWLSQVTFYFFFHLGERLAGSDASAPMAGGAESLCFLHAVLTMLRFAVLLAAFRRLSGSLALACGGVAAAVLLSSANLMVQRPQVVGELLFALVLLALSRPLLQWAFLWLPLVFVTWANTHSSFLVGLVLLVLALVGRCVEAASAGDGRSWTRPFRDSQVRRLVLVLGLSVVAILVLNPHGPLSAHKALAVARNPHLFNNKDWQPLAFQWGLGLHVPFLTSLLALALTHWVSPRAFTPTQVLFLVVFAVGTCCQQRLMVWWAMVVPWVMVPHWSAAWAEAYGAGAPARSQPTLHKTLLAGAIVVAAFLGSGLSGLLLTGQPRPLEALLSEETPWRLNRQLRAPTDPQAQWLPALAQRLQRSYPSGQFAGGIFATPTLGDYLTAALAPDYPVSAYNHSQVFTTRHWEELAAVALAAPGWGEILENRAVNLLVFEADACPALREALAGSADWEVLLDESDSPGSASGIGRRIIAIRKQPLSARKAALGRQETPDTAGRLWGGSPWSSLNGATTPRYRERLQGTCNRKYS